MASCASQPSYGKVYTIFSNKVVFLSSLLIFEIGSVVCATAPSSYALIIGRAIAGLGSAGIQAGTTLIIAECVPLPRRPTWNSIIGSFFAIGSVVGPLLVNTCSLESYESSGSIFDVENREVPSHKPICGVGVSS